MKTTRLTNKEYQTVMDERKREKEWKAFQKKWTKPDCPYGAMTCEPYQIAYTLDWYNTFWRLEDLEFKPADLPAH